MYSFFKLPFLKCLIACCPRAMVPIYMTFSMAQFIGPMLMVVVDEKEKRIKESLRMVSLILYSPELSVVAKKIFVSSTK